MKQTGLRGHLQIVILLAVCGWVWHAGGPSPAHAQWLKRGPSELASPLLDGTPFDLIFLNSNGDRAIMKVRPPKTPFPTNPPDQGIYLFEFLEGERLQVPFSSIDKYVPFNELLIDEAKNWLQRKKYAQALRNLLYVYDRGGSSNNELVQLLQLCLFEDALDNLQNQRFEFALTIFEDLYARDPAFRIPGLNKSLIEVIIECHDGMLFQDFDAGEYLSVRLKVDLVRENYGAEADSLVEKWGQRIDGKIDELKQMALAEADDGNARLAHLYSREAEQLAPGDPEIKEIQVAILRRFPLIVVGTTQPAGDINGQSLEHWGARRVGRLVQRTLVELVDTSDEGGRYSFLNGTLTQVDEMGLKYAFDLTAVTAYAVPETTPYHVASRLLSAANPESPIYNVQWQKILDRVQIDEGKVLVTLRVPFVKPEPLMRILYEDPLEPEIEDSQIGLSQNKSPRQVVQNGAYQIVERQNRSTTLERNPAYSPLANQQHPVLIEQLYRNASEAVDELIKGNIDVIDRVPPGDLERLKRASNIVVRPYAVPTVHLLIPKIRGDMKDNLFFRSGLSHGIDRNTLLRKAICNGRDVSGCEVLSGPFPVGTEENESIAYAYDPRVRPPFFSSHMAGVLIDMSLIMDAQLKAKKLQEEQASYKKSLAASKAALDEQELAAQKATEEGGLLPKDDETLAPKSDTPTDTPEPISSSAARTSIKSPAPNLVLAHPSGSTATEAAMSIAATWSMMGVPTTTLAMDPDEAIPSHDDWDVLYLELTMEEPLTDIMRLVGRNGITAEVSSVAEQTLQQLAFTGSWRLASNLLRRLHRQLAVDITIIPLYQVKEHYAYRNTVSGVGRGLMHLYQNVERWKIDVFSSDETD